MDAFEILVVILSVTLALFLLLAIVFVVSLIKLTKQIRQITEKAEGIVDEVGAASSFFRKSATTVTFASVVSNIVDKVTDYKHSKKGK